MKIVKIFTVITAIVVLLPGAYLFAGEGYRAAETKQFNDEFDEAVDRSRYRKTKETEILSMIERSTRVLHNENQQILRELKKLSEEIALLKEKK